MDGGHVVKMHKMASASKCMAVRRKHDKVDSRWMLHCCTVNKRLSLPFMSKTCDIVFLNSCYSKYGRHVIFYWHVVGRHRHRRLCRLRRISHVSNRREEYAIGNMRSGASIAAIPRPVMDTRIVHNTFTCRKTS